MRILRLKRFAIAGALGAALIVGGEGSAIAEPTGDEIIVEAPRPLPAPAERSPYSGAPVAVTTVKISVLFGDLDLSRETDAARLMARIDRGAQDACGYLDRLFPLNPDPDCVGTAVGKARVTAKARIAADTR